MIAYASVPTVSAVAPKHCVFVTVDNGSNPLSVRLLKKMELLRRAAQTAGKHGQQIHICCSGEEASRFQDSSVVAVYDVLEFDSLYSPSCAAKVSGKPSWASNLGYVVRVKKGIQDHCAGDQDPKVEARLERSARQILSVFAKVGTVSDAELFGSPAVSWRVSRRNAADICPGKIRMKSDSVCR